MRKFSSCFVRRGNPVGGTNGGCGVFWGIEVSDRCPEGAEQSMVEAAQDTFRGVNSVGTTRKGYIRIAKIGEGKDLTC